jgi:hypothetical protein
VVLGNVGTATDTRCSGLGATRSALGRDWDGCGIWGARLDRRGGVAPPVVQRDGLRRQQAF